MKNISEVAGIDKLFGGVYQWNLQLLSPNACKVAKLKPIFKKGKKFDPSNYCHWFQKSLKK